MYAINIVKNMENRMKDVVGNYKCLECIDDNHILNLGNPDDNRCYSLTENNDLYPNYYFNLQSNKYEKMC